MDWTVAYQKLGHRLFINFIELKIKGHWRKGETKDDHNALHNQLFAETDDSCFIDLIEPDGMRRMFHFTKGGTIAIHQNILSYHPDQVEEIAIDEKEQSGKGKTRDMLR